MSRPRRTTPAQIKRQRRQAWIEFAKIGVLLAGIALDWVLLLRALEMAAWQQ